MKRALVVSIMMLPVLAGLAGYCFLRWQECRGGSIVVLAPDEATVSIEGEFIQVTTKPSHKVSLGYGRYVVRVPEYNVECVIHKNNRGNAVIRVSDMSEFTAEFDSNAWLVSE